MTLENIQALNTIKRPSLSKKSPKSFYNQQKGKSTMKTIRFLQTGIPDYNNRTFAYISGLPEDVEAYYPRIKNDLLNIKARATFFFNYDIPRDLEPEMEKREVSDEEYRYFFVKLHMMIVIVSKAYLEVQPDTLIAEYKYAMDNHLTIIPLCFVAGLENDFSRVMNNICPGYGDIQLIYCGNNSNYFNALKNRVLMLVNDDSIDKKIREAFSASLFISYRRVNKMEMLDLIRIIHNIPGCEDIAVWYDDQILAGEIWRETIKSAIKNSDAVILAVTPELLESGNYVLDNEYIWAVEYNKEIIPIMLSDTDLSKLFDSLAGLRNPIQINDTKEIRKALSQCIQLNETYDSEKQNYMGLGYLSGFCVEKDVLRAEKLLIASAEKENEDAMRKLAEMYGYGNGLSINRDEEIKWLRRILNIKKSALANKQDYQSLFAVQGAFMDLYDTLYYKTCADNVAEKMEEELESFKCIADTYLSTKKSNEEPAFFWEAYSYYVWLAEANVTTGLMYKNQNNNEKAEKLINDALKIQISMYTGEVNEEFGFVNQIKDQFSHSVGLMFDLVQSYHFLIGILLERDQFEKAIEHTASEMTIAIKYIKEYPYELWATLAMSLAYSDLGWIKVVAEGNLNEAKKCFEGSDFCVSKVISTTNLSLESLPWFTMAERTYQKAAITCLLSLDYSIAVQFINKAIAIGEKIQTIKAKTLFHNYNISCEIKRLIQTFYIDNYRPELIEKRIREIASYYHFTNTATESVVSSTLNEGHESIIKDEQFSEKFDETSNDLLSLESDYESCHKTLTVYLDTDNVERAIYYYERCCSLLKKIISIKHNEKNANRIMDEHLDFIEILIDNRMMEKAEALVKETSELYDKLNATITDTQKKRRIEKRIKRYNKKCTA